MIHPLSTHDKCKRKRLQPRAGIKRGLATVNRLGKSKFRGPGIQAIS
ncbi:MAG: hypothetical protein JWQ09_5224 [Segetibacter sp.]|nr:hypothetical protein [Segetibacter sp.]